MNNQKPNVLFIASNIPTPKRSSNKVIITIAEKLSYYFNIQILHPAERIPFPLLIFEKYRTIAKNINWKNGQINIFSFKYLRLPGIKFSFLLLPYYKRKIEKFCEINGIPELIHAHFILPDGYLAFLIKKIYDTPYILSVRNSDLKYMDILDSDSRIFKQYLKVLKDANKIIVHNKYQYNKLKLYGFESKIMAHGIEKELFIYNSKKNEQEIIISSIGQLITQKNIGWVIDGIKEYRGDKKLKLFIAGDGRLRKELELSATGLDIVFLGIISHEEIIKILEESSIFALPAINETFGLVYLEATATKNAVIASKNTGIWGHFEENKEMLFCDSYESFKNELHLLIDNSKIRTEIAENGFNKTKINFTWDKIIDIYKDIYIEQLDHF
jgi:glycosyltransferase involved in cell wall biosynthesis